MPSSFSPTRLLARLRAILRKPAALAGYVRQWSGYLSFKKCYAFLKVSEASAPEKHLLLISLTDWVPRLLMEGVIAAFLRLKGHKVSILTYSTNAWAVRYFRTIGIPPIFFDAYVSRAEKDLPAGLIDSIFTDHLSFKGLYDFTWNNVFVGRQALSTVVRKLQNGTVEFHDPQVLSYLRALIPEALAGTLAAQRLYADLQPDVILFLEKGYTPYASLFDVAISMEIPAVQYHHAQESHLFNMKRYSEENRAQHAFSLSRGSWETVKAIPWTDAEEQTFLSLLKKGYENGSWFNRKFLLHDKKIKTPEQIRAQLGLDPSKKTAVIFSHVLWDATFFFGTNLFADYETWLLETVKVAIKNTSVNWIIKVHPDYMWKMKGQEGKDPRDTVALRGAFGTLPSHIAIVTPDTDISTYSFFGITDYCITVRGTIGIEAPCFGIPVFTAGTGRYSSLGFTHDFDSPSSYLAAMASIQDYPPLSKEETTLARKHAFGLFRMRPLAMRSFEMEPVAKPDGTFDTETVIRVRTREELEQAPDLSAFADWLFSRDAEEDYLTPYDPSLLR